MLTCESPDENRNTTEVNIVGFGQGDVYVWGSNSSHQLAEGNQEKVMQPKLATAFESIQQVCNACWDQIILTMAHSKN